MIYHHMLINLPILNNSLLLLYMSTIINNNNTNLINSKQIKYFIIKNH